jgi:C4-dicarboxylate-specific signal transduction histidine kinase
MTANVLFVDDEEANLLVCEAVCGDSFHVLTASSAEQALALMRSSEVGVVIADQRMPKTTGVELLERVRDEHPQAVRILITAYSDMPVAIDAINRGHVRRYLKKPWEPEELKAEIRDALERYQTSRKLSDLERRLTETERLYALGVVAAGIAHELRNPITWIVNNLEHALGELGETDAQLARGTVEVGRLRTQVAEISAALSDASAGAQRIREIVAGIEMSTMRPSHLPQVVDLSEVLRLALRLVYGELKRCAKLELDVNCSPKIQGSTTKVEQVALNLLVNAIHAVSGGAREQSVISARLRVDGTHAYLEIADNGPGVAVSDLERIFDPFFTTKPGIGTGLGLAISRRIAEELGGKLEVSRDERLGGALFRFSLPLAADDQGA